MPHDDRSAKIRPEARPWTKTAYLLQPTIFPLHAGSTGAGQHLRAELPAQRPEAASIASAAVETFSELLNNAAEHGMSDDGAHCHVRLMPHRTGQCLDIVVADSGPGIRATLTQNPNLPTTQSDAEAIALAIQELTTGTGTLARGIRLKTTATEMRRPGRKLLIHSGTGLLTMYGTAEPEVTSASFRQGALIRVTIPF